MQAPTNAIVIIQEWFYKHNVNGVSLAEFLVLSGYEVVIPDAPSPPSVILQDFNITDLYGNILFNLEI